MPRSARTLVDRGYYHVLTRGNDKKTIFRDDLDYKKFLLLLEDSLSLFDVRLLHFCLMPNHLHLLACSLKALDLPLFMKRILQRYAAYFKKNYDAVGFVFQNRYKSILIQRESYLLECARYIERNPLRSGIVKDPGEYRWSSYSFYSYGATQRIVNLVNPLYEELGNTEQERQSKYRAYILEERPYERIVDSYLKM